MTNDRRKYLLFAFAGALAGALGSPILGGYINMPSLLTAFIPGVIFSLFTMLATASALPKILNRVSFSRWLIFGIGLAVGMPIALVAGFAVFAISDHFAPGIRYHLGDVGFSFFCAELASCLIWSLALVFSLYPISRPPMPRFLMICFGITVLIMFGANVVEIFSKMLFQKSFLLPLVSVGEQMASASILAFGMLLSLAKIQSGRESAGT